MTVCPAESKVGAPVSCSAVEEQTELKLDYCVRKYMWSPGYKLDADLVQLKFEVRPCEMRLLDPVLW